jgi:biotin carboxyl carrier protein
MKYKVEIDGRQMSVELGERNGRIVATVGERTYRLEVARPEPGAFLMFEGDQVYEARVWAVEPDSLTVRLGDHWFAAKVSDRKQRRSVAEQDEGRQHLIAPMPGKVVRVMLGVGDAVVAGQGVLVVEAMKMQNEIKSPKSGRVVEIRVIEGATVNANQVLAVVE